MPVIARPYRTEVSASRRQQSGFTLLEIIVVVFLISLVTSLVVAKIGRNPGRLANLEAHRFLALVDHAREESAFLGEMIGIEVNSVNSSYTFVSGRDEWKEIERDDVLRQRKLPDGVSFRLHLAVTDDASATELDVESSGNRVIINPIGEVTPFVLYVKGGNSIYRVLVDYQQQLKVIEDDIEKSKSE